MLADKQMSLARFGIGHRLVMREGIREMRSQLRRFASRMTKKTTGAVTLVIYGWSESQPGTLAWVFPSLKSALRAVRAMRNALRWIIVKGRQAFEGDVDIDALRQAGRILMEGAA